MKKIKAKYRHLRKLWHERVRTLSKARTATTDPGYCLRETREVLDVPASAADAIGAWRAAHFKHIVPPFTRPLARLAFIREIPAGAPLFWEGGSAGHGHIALQAYRRRRVWSVDMKRSGFWDRVALFRFTVSWRLKFLGWTEDLNGVRVIERG